jgi:DNA-binding CsgD family transcriptional regulator
MVLRWRMVMSLHLIVTFLPDEDVFVGRKRELAQLADMVARVRQGQPWLVTIEGESGVGKTALARRLMASSPGLTPLWARADPSETDLDYGIIGQLVRRVDRRVLARYPLLAGDMVRAAPFAVGAEFLGLVGAQQQAGLVALVIDDMQWADRRSVEALSFTFRRLSVDAVAVVAIIRGDREQLDAAARQFLLSTTRRQRMVLSGLRVEDVAPLAAALGAEQLDPDAIQRLHDRTGGHTLYLRTMLSDTEGPRQSAVPESLAAAIGDQLAALPASTRSLLDLLAVVNGPVPLALLGTAAEVAEPTAAIQPALRAGLADLTSDEPVRPVAIRHALQRDALYAALTADRRRELHAKAVTLVDGASGWAHRVAALDCPHEGLASELEQLASTEAASGQLALAATHLQWAAGISPAQADRERRLLTAALHLALGDEARGLALCEAVQASAASPLRTCVLGTLAFSAGQPREAETLFSQALAQVMNDPDSRPLAAVVSNRLSGTYTVLGDGEKVMRFARQALEIGCLDEAATSQTRTLVAIGASQLTGARPALAELGHLHADPARIGPADIDGLAFRGIFRLMAGDLTEAIRDMAASLKLARRGATFALGLRAYSYLALAQYLAGAWDDVQLTVEQGFSAAAIHARQYEMPLLHLAATCVPAGRGMTEEAERHARLAEEAAGNLGYGQERLYAAMARALVCQAAADYAGMTAALGHWREEAVLDNRSRLYTPLWRPLLVEGLAGVGRAAQAPAALEQMRTSNGQVSYLQAAIAWLDGQLAEQRGAVAEAQEIYARGEEAAGSQSPVYTARLLLAHGRLLRRTGNRKEAVERLRRASDLYGALRAAPFLAWTEQELAACGLRQKRTEPRSVLAMTDRESEVASLVERGMTNAEIGAELFITPKAVEYHLGNIYAKFGLRGRQQLRRLLSDSRRPALT